MGDSALQSGAHESCSSFGMQKTEKVRLFMPMMNCCSSKRRKTSSYDHGAFHDHEDLIWEILFRLPPKHVLRCKCVSKRWYSIISDPEFLRNHSLRFHRHFLQPSREWEFLLLPLRGGKEVLLLNLLDHLYPDQPLAHLFVLPITGVLPVTAESSDFLFVDSCNGLLLYADPQYKKGVRGSRCISHDLCIDDDDDLYYLWNPVTKNYIKLPNLMHVLLFKEDESERLVVYTNVDTRISFDPSVSLSYKVVRLVYRTVLDGGGCRQLDIQFQFYIYSSESGSWRLSASVADGFNFASPNSVFLNGVIYWVTCGTDLLCFDAEKSSVWFQPLPLKPKRKRKQKRSYGHYLPLYFGKCGGRLRLVEKYSHSYTLHDGFDVMEMTTEEDSRWIKKYHVNLEVNHRHLIGAEISLLHIYKTRNLSKEEEEEEEEEEALLMKIDGRIVSFSFKSNTFFGKELTIPNSPQPAGYCDIHPVNVTLFPL